MNDSKRQQNLHAGEKKEKKRKWYSLIDKIWSTTNLELAFYDVKKNRGSHGVDKVTIKEYEMELEHNLRVLQKSLKDKTYRTRPVRRVYIPKVDGTQRPLGIPTVQDRIVQAAVKRKLEPIFEEKFLDCSYGFRPNRSAHMAIEKIRKDLMDGFTFVIDADIKTYFDTIPHEKLIALVKEEVVDGSVLSLLQQFLKSGIFENGIVHESKHGSPQGGVISPLLANIYLHPLDELMTSRGHRLTRYADDFVICCRSRKGAERVLKSVKKLLEDELGLIVHPEKTKIVDNMKEPFTFLGYTFNRGFWHKPSEKAIKKFKDKIKKVTRRNLTVNLEQFIKHRVNPIIRGWGRYFGIGFSAKIFKELDSWIRRRLRMIQLRSWKKIKKLHKELRKSKWEGELPKLRMNRWRSSKTPPVHFALSNKWFSERKLVFLIDIHKELHTQGE
ncbi:group II intron reverse transcriptase/maturase [Robertmurraya andreesenii]|uniref:Group II intron reverse transcriptase/maturase n=1 Tax=Anoxybacillus andreesenii TaxID=1325932 RepID=A0ABT9VAP5_9BACL|nr:group II intron reverse transcriptase/maturase [Robertmurraya andreesenii]MDQ0158038.1 group II intron reverse transcriptase/maturase [Robertmurraya andreesenii]